MRQLLLIRHAKAVWDQKRFEDRERPLSAGGERAASALGRMMAMLELRPERVLASPAGRSLQTLDRLELELLPAAISAPDALYLASSAELLRELRGVPDATESLLIVGHNPGLHELAKLLLATRGGDAEIRLRRGFPTAALVEFTTDALWCELGPRTARLVRFVTPHDLPANAAPKPTGMRT